MIIISIQMLVFAYEVTSGKALTLKERQVCVQLGGALTDVQSFVLGPGILAGPSSQTVLFKQNSNHLWKTSEQRLERWLSCRRPGSIPSIYMVPSTTCYSSQELFWPLQDRSAQIWCTDRKAGQTPIHVK